MKKLMVTLGAGLLFASIVSSYMGAREIVWYQGDVPSSSVGARIIPCPIDDCAPLYEIAARRLRLDEPDHPPIERQRLGVSVCSRDPSILCNVSPPIGRVGAFIVVLDPADGPPAFVDVQCWLSPGNGGLLAEWNGMFCQA